MCKSRKRQQIEYAKPGIIEHKSYNEIEKEPWFVACDMESTLLPINEKVGESTTNVAKHRVNSIFWILHLDENLDNFPYNDFNRDKLYQTILMTQRRKKSESLMSLTMT